jgi:hypothetical protein
MTGTTPWLPPRKKCVTPETAATALAMVSVLGAVGTTPRAVACLRARLLTTALVWTKCHSVTETDLVTCWVAQYLVVAAVARGRPRIEC